GKFYYNILYLSRWTGLGLERARAWLKKHDFPSSVTKPIGPDPRAFQRVIDELKEGGWDNIEAGVGRSSAFAHVLVDNRIQAIILSDKSSKTQKFPRRAKLVETWKEVRKEL
ncbi:MAG: hypothetical protein D6704_07445, partial [Nitrospirae bacterium]